MLGDLEQLSKSLSYFYPSVKARYSCQMAAFRASTTTYGSYPIRQNAKPMHMQPIYRTNPYQKKTLDLSVGDASVADQDRPIHDFIWYIQQETLDTAEKYYDLDSFFGGQSRVAGSQLYIDNGIWNPTNNIWPRCAILPEYVDDYSFMQTDVSALLAEYRAQFVTGKLDVDAEWDNFQSKLNNLGVEEMIKIVQESYDAFMK